MDNPPVDRESDREGANTGDELPIPRKRKLGQLERADNVDSKSDNPAKDSGESPRRRKHRQPRASREDSSSGLPILDLDSEFPHVGTARDSGDGKHGKHGNNDDQLEGRRAVSTARPTSPSRQESTPLHDIEPLHDGVGNGGHN